MNSVWIIQNSMTDKSTEDKNMDVNEQIGAFISIEAARRRRIIRGMSDFLNVANGRREERGHSLLFCLFFAAEPTRRSTMLLNQSRCTKS